MQKKTQTTPKNKTEVVHTPNFDWKPPTITKIQTKTHTTGKSKFDPAEDPTKVTGPS
jgi:hypothetical protein